MSFFILRRNISSRKYFEFIRVDWMSQVGLNNSALEIRGQYKADQIVAYQKESGKLISPILYDGILFLLNQELIDVLISKGVTGWKSTPAILNFSSSEKRGDYSRFFITGEVGNLIYDKNPIKLIPKEIAKSNVDLKHRVGLDFNKNTWDGSDIFMSTDTSGYIFITKYVKELFEKYTHYNIEIIPIEEVKHWAVY